MTQVRDRFWWTLYVVGAITVASGLIQCFAPALLLRVVSPEVTVAGRHFLTITGIFTGAFGALLIHALKSPDPQHAAILWTGIQKVLTAAVVGMAIQDTIFTRFALAAAAFDMVSGVMIISYWFWIRHLQQSQ